MAERPFARAQGDMIHIFIGISLSGTNIIIKGTAEQEIRPDLPRHPLLAKPVSLRSGTPNFCILIAWREKPVYYKLIKALSER